MCSLKASYAHFLEDAGQHPPKSHYFTSSRPQIPSPHPTPMPRQNRACTTVAPLMKVTITDSTREVFFFLTYWSIQVRMATPAALPQRHLRRLRGQAPQSVTVQSNGRSRGVARGGAQEARAPPLSCRAMTSYERVLLLYSSQF